jgi:hypothetical protein
MQDKKTICNGRKLVTGINCVAQSAFNEMVNTKLQYRKSGGRQYYHIMQSFHPDEPITPETAHEIALRFAKENGQISVFVLSTYTEIVVDSTAKRR